MISAVCVGTANSCASCPKTIRAIDSRTRVERRVGESLLPRYAVTRQPVSMSPAPAALNLFIPARAGNTTDGCVFKIVPSVHPRAGGEHLRAHSLERARAELDVGVDAAAVVQPVAREPPLGLRGAGEGRGARLAAVVEVDAGHERLGVERGDELRGIGHALAPAVRRREHPVGAKGRDDLQRHGLRRLALRAERVGVDGKRECVDDHRARTVPGVQRDDGRGRVREGCVRTSTSRIAGPGLHRYRCSGSAARVWCGQHGATVPPARRGDCCNLTGRVNGR